MKKYLNIKEASKIIGLKEHVIRYWDSVDPKTNKLRIDGISTKSRAGTRYFNKDNLNKLKGLKDLIYENGKTSPNLKLAEKLMLKKSNKIKTYINNGIRPENSQNLNQILEKMRNLLR
tara:strand:- start:113 stop:466 length:354 start_codon:yes stop_codon:yes gene_type:complete